MIKQMEPDQQSLLAEQTQAKGPQSLLNDQPIIEEEIPV